MKKLALTSLLFAAITTLNAQKIEQGFDAFFKPTAGAARYYVITEKKENLWHRQAYYLPERSMAMEGWYKDSLGKEAEGLLNWYHLSKYLKSTGKYKEGKKEGAWLEYDEEGRLQDSAFYVGGQLKGIRLKWHPDGMLADSMHFDGAGNGVQMSWDKEGNLIAAGFWTADTVRKGRWKYFHANGALLATEDYVNGEVTTYHCYDKSGKELNAADCKGKEAEFPGGVGAWANFLRRNLNASTPTDKGAPVGQYTIVVQFIVHTDGSISDLKALTKFGYGMESEVLRIMTQLPKWIPAQQYGRPVKAYRRQPITFVVSEG